MSASRRRSIGCRFCKGFRLSQSNRQPEKRLQRVQPFAWRCAAIPTLTAREHQPFAVWI